MKNTKRRRACTPLILDAPKQTPDGMHGSSRIYLLAIKVEQRLGKYMQLQ